MLELNLKTVLGENNNRRDKTATFALNLIARGIHYNVCMCVKSKTMSQSQIDA